MYAKLLVGSTSKHPHACIRDIIRLCTSANPSIADLEAYTVATGSQVIDATPAGWTFVGSNYGPDQNGTLSTGSSGGTTSGWLRYGLSAPCLDGRTKYCVLNTVLGTSSPMPTVIQLSGATGFTGDGTATNQGSVFYASSTSITESQLINASLRVGSANRVMHVIANARHITIIDQDRGMSAIWEMTSTDMNSRYNTAPFVQYCHADTTYAWRANNGSVYPSGPVNITASLNGSWQHMCFGLTDPNTSTYYGLYDPCNVHATNPQFPTTNATFFCKTWGGNPIQGNGSAATGGTLTVARAVRPGVDITGLPKYNIQPVMLANDRIGWPTQFITGVVPVYFGPGEAGTAGDTTEINGETYYYFPCGAWGLFMKLN